MVGAGCPSLPSKLYLLLQFLQWWASQFFRVKPAKKKTEKTKQNKKEWSKEGPHNSTTHGVHNLARKHALLKN